MMGTKGTGDVVDLCAVRAGVPMGEARGDAIERFCVRLELAWRRRPGMTLGRLLAAAQANCLAAQVALGDEALVEAVEKFAGLR